ncbi:MAG: 23S rRNA (pseudouridine(1915)-N(3))-methyltransferase RlmH [Firmicutes bacterium HGW-Firmicutes-15]|nr:MAG: 23S rRNA (pseudouridine(1915)-N(3))-methyltransferase RlmH [Firmicutes bacterium HGW-Firmicutes-15]
MKYRIISVGKIREKFYVEGVNEYIKRLVPYTGIELVEGLEEKVSPRAGEKDIEKVLRKEGERILALLGDKEILVVLDGQGELLSSEDLARCMGNWNMSGLSRVNLVIGGSHGLADIVKKRANHIISFSRMTFPHQMAVLILSEQVYRGFKILKGEPYHK